MVDVNPYVIPRSSPPLFSQMWVSSFVVKFAPASLHSFFTTRQSVLQSSPSAHSEVLRGGLKQVPSIFFHSWGHSAETKQCYEINHNILGYDHKPLYCEKDISYVSFFITRRYRTTVASFSALFPNRVNLAQNVQHKSGFRFTKHIFIFTFSWK